MCEASHFNAPMPRGLHTAPTFPYRVPCLTDGIHIAVPHHDVCCRVSLGLSLPPGARCHSAATLCTELPTMISPGLLWATLGLWLCLPWNHQSCAAHPLAKAQICLWPLTLLRPLTGAISPPSHWDNSLLPSLGLSSHNNSCAALQVTPCNLTLHCCLPTGANRPP